MIAVCLYNNGKLFTITYVNKVFSHKKIALLRHSFGYFLIVYPFTLIPKSRG